MRSLIQFVCDLFHRKPAPRPHRHYKGWTIGPDGSYHLGESVIHRAGTNWERVDVSEDGVPVVRRHATLHLAIADGPDAPLIAGAFTDGTALSCPEFSVRDFEASGGHSIGLGTALQNGLPWDASKSAMPSAPIDSVEY